MAYSELLPSKMFNIIFEKDLIEKLPFNYIIIFNSANDYSAVFCSLINNKIKIFLKEPSSSKKGFFTSLFTILKTTDSSLPFYLLKSDEAILASLYRDFKLKIIKEWFFSITKKIDKTNKLHLSKNFDYYITFETKAYIHSSRKQSTSFYFIDLFLQYLERKISLSTSISSSNHNSIPELLSETDYNLCFSHTFPASEQSYDDCFKLSNILQQKLQSKGIAKLFSYQVKAITSILQGNNTIITAPTGNGKTESFLLPVLEKLLNWKSHGILGVKAILLYPTKALASDQVAKITFFTRDTPIKYIQLDSDVPQSDRINIFEEKDVDLLITTPDLIHYSLHREDFKKFIETTKIILFDEIHTYTGVFGTHIFYFLRRLERVLLEGKFIQFIAASATIANPVEFTSKLFQREMIHIDCTTPKKNTTELYCVLRQKTTSHYDALFQLIILLTQSLTDEKIIVFRNSQQESEKTFEKLSLIKNKKIALHRAGLTKDQRTRIEKQLRDNQIDVVVTTTTLEVGIDIGGISTIITPLVSVNRLLQRIGRAGRGNKPAKIFLELEHDPISYYYANHVNSYLKDISPVNISIENKSISKLHGNLLCLENNQLTEADLHIFGTMDKRESNLRLFSLRNVNEVIEVRTERGFKVTEKALPNAFYEFYPFAQILHNLMVYKVLRMERDKTGNINAIVKPCKEKYDYTLKMKPLIEKKVFTNKKSLVADYLGEVEVKVSDCLIHLEYKGNVINYKEQVLCESYKYEYASKCVIFNFESLIEKMIQEERTQQLELGSIIHSMSHVLFKASKMKIFCGTDLLNLENTIGKWKIVFVDNAINGNGMSELLYQKRDEIWERAIQLLQDCKCSKKEGCIKCTMDFNCQHKNKWLVKDVFNIFSKN